MPTKINEVFDVSEADLEKEGVFNGFVDLDSKFYVDPHLLENVEIPEFNGSYSLFKGHFTDVIRILTQTKHKGDVFFRTAHKKLIFPELPIVSLGYSTEGNVGSGIGSGIARKLTGTALEIIRAGISDPIIFELVGLIEENIGADRISDMTIFIILSDLLSYSERVAKNLDLNTRSIKVRGQNFLLPVDRNKKVAVFLPKKILNDLPVAHGLGDIEEVCRHNDQLRERVNEIIGDSFRDANGRKRKITKRELKYILLNCPEILKEIIEQYKRTPAAGYNFEKDPSGQLIWKDIAQEYSKIPSLSPDVDEVKAENILEIVLKICKHFKTLVESNGLAIHLWGESGKLRNERFSQLLFFGIADAYCEAHNLDLSREPNAGRGPVDFKVSKGYKSRVNVEIKYTSNNIKAGYKKQLPVYNAAERTQHSILLVIKTTDSTKSLDDLLQLRRDEIAAGKQAPEICVVDGRIKPSASKVK